MPKKLKSLWKEKKITLVIILILLMMFFMAFGAKIYLYINFLLGNDTVIKLETSKEYIYLKNGNEETIEFEASVTTNPFCTAQCEYTFKDISRNIDISQDRFTLRPGKPLRKAFKIKATQIGTGQELYRFDIECHSKSSLLCHAGNKPTTRNKLIAVNYDLNEKDKQLKEELRKDLETMSKLLSELEAKNKALEQTLNQINETLILSNLYERINQNKRILDYNRVQMNHLEVLWEKQDYARLVEKVPQIKPNLEQTGKDIENLYKEIIIIINDYNDIIERISAARQTLVKIKELFQKKQILALTINKTIEEYNDALNKIHKMGYLSKKKEITDNVYSKINSSSINIIKLLNEYQINCSSMNSTCNQSNLTLLKISQIYLGKISMRDYLIEDNEIKFNEPKPICCVFGKCQPCCLTEECLNDERNYPVVFLHGHAVNKDVSAEYSLEGFNKIQKRMEEDGYLNAGAITLYTPEDFPRGLWGLPRVPLTIRASYYFDLFKEPENYRVVQAKSENIDTYAVRLSDLIKTIQYRTGKPKVNIVAFSMGGLVARRYAQIFGTEKINKMVLIGTPNKGIVGEVSDFCPLIGEKLECRDMEENSLFMNKLNREPLKGVPVYTIIGTGCDTDGKDGDGIVQAEKSYLEWAENYYINGTCRSKFEPLHLDLRDIDLYPETYDVLMKILKK